MLPVIPEFSAFLRRSVPSVFVPSAVVSFVIIVCIMRFVTEYSSPSLRYAFEDNDNLGISRSPVAQIDRAAQAPATAVQAAHRRRWSIPMIPMSPMPYYLDLPPIRPVSKTVVRRQYAG